MEDTKLRPPEELIKKTCDYLFDSGNSLSKIRDAALADRLFPSSNDAVGATGRSLAWKMFLIPEEPLQMPSNLSPLSLLDALQASRNQYIRLISEKMRAPDGSYEEDFVLPDSAASQKRATKAPGNLAMNNPLSLHEENPWREWFASVELRKTILQDVERTFPEIGFFRDAEVQLQLTNILFLYSVMNPAIGYRQGMHELLAPLYYAVDYDSIVPDGNLTIDTSIIETCSRTWIAADAWALFQSVMRGVSQWYEWREPSPHPTPRGSLSPLSTHVNIDIPEGQIDMKPYVAPIVQACNRIQSTLLRATDPLLWKHMQATGIEPQIYGIRWLRLLFTREFGLPDAMKLWDGLFACGPSFELAQWVCVAMLIRIRNDLIPADYTGQLTVLLRYPSPSSRSEFDGAPHHASLLLRQALALQMSPTPSTGASVVIENRNLLNIVLEVPEPPPAPQRRSIQGGKAKSAFGSNSRTVPGAISAQHSRQTSSPQIGIPEMIARGLLERGESLGINKTFMSAVSELRRNIPDLAASLVRSPTTPEITFPMEDERPPEERPPWEPRTRFEMERDIAQMRSVNMRLGESLGWIVDVLLQDEGEAQDRQRLANQKREALESLSYIRDVLRGNATGLEEDRLIGEEELRRRKLKAQKEADGKILAGAVNIPPPIAPVAVPVVHSRPKHLSSHSSRTYRPHSPPQPASGTSPPSSRHAPWNYTQSSFSDGRSALPATTLPRLPPPAQPGQKSSDQTPHRSEAQHDPLGVLR